MKRAMKTVHAPTEREPGFPADGIDLEFYHFLCHKSPRLWSLRFDQCQHFCLYALLKCFTLIVWGMVIFTLEKLGNSVFSLPHKAASCVVAELKVKRVRINTCYGSKRWDFFVSDPPPQYTEALEDFSSILCEAGTCVI